jgi:hypothetical protein
LTQPSNEVSCLKVREFPAIFSSIPLVCKLGYNESKIRSCNVEREDVSDGIEM